MACFLRPATASAAVALTLLRAHGPPYRSIVVVTTAIAGVWVLLYEAYASAALFGYKGVTPGRTALVVSPLAVPAAAAVHGVARIRL